MSQNEITKIREQADFLLEVGRYAEAQSVIAKGLSIAPDDYDLLCNMSRAFNKKDEWEGSLEYAQKAIQAAPDKSWAYILHSSALSHLKRYKEAIVSAKEAVKLSPDYAGSWHALSYAHYYASNNKEARAAAEKMLELSPDWYLTHQMITLVALKEGNLDEAEKHCRKELEINPNSYFGMNNLGVVMERRGRKKEAIDYYHRAAKLNPTEELARSNLKQGINKFLPTVTLGIAAACYIVLIRFLIEGKISTAKALLISFLLSPVAAFAIYKWRKHYNALTDEQIQFFHAENKKLPARMIVGLLSDFLFIANIISVIVVVAIVIAFFINRPYNQGISSVLPYLIVAIISSLVFIGCRFARRSLSKYRQS